MSRNREKNIRRVVRKFHPWIIGLQETKLVRVDDFKVRAMWSGSNVKWEAINANGRSSGTLAMWACNVVRVPDRIEGEFSLTLFCEKIDLDKKWTYTIVYGPVDRNEKVRFWEELSAIGASVGGQWCVR